MKSGPKMPNRYERRSYPAHVIAFIVRQLGAEGLPSEEALKGTRLEIAALSDPLTRISIRQFLRVFENAMTLTADPLFALRAGQNMHVSSFGFYGYAIHCSSSHREAAEFSTKYNDIVSPFARLSFSIDKNVATYTIEPDTVSVTKFELCRFIIELKLSALFTVQRDLYGANFKLNNICVNYDSPEYAEKYMEIFGCPVTFNASSITYSFPTSYLDTSMIFADPTTHAVLKQVCDDAIRQIGAMGGVAGLVQSVLMHQPGHFPGFDEIASELAMSARNLRRKLDAENTTYREILSEVRRRLALNYMQSTAMTNDEIACRLGYRSQSAFHHAFIKWAGDTPAAYRRRIFRECE